MTENVISFTEAREKKDADRAEYRFSVDVSVTPMGMVCGNVHGWEIDETGEGSRLRDHAKLLETLAFMMRQRAEQVDQSDDGECLATLQVFESSRVRMRVNDDRVVTDNQKAWLAETIDTAKTLILASGDRHDR